MSHVLKKRFPLKILNCNFAMRKAVLLFTVWIRFGTDNGDFRGLNIVFERCLAFRSLVRYLSFPFLTKFDYSYLEYVHALLNFLVQSLVLLTGHRWVRLA